MTVELESRPEVALAIPLELKPRKIGWDLLAEAFQYPELVEAEEIEKVGTFTSFRLHESRVGRWISIHFRENLHLLLAIGSEWDQGKAFITGVQKDLELLAQKLEELRLSDVGMVIGLSGISEKWGRKHGFTTMLFTKNKRIIRKHNRSIANNPRALKDKLNPLNLFLFPRLDFIEEFSKE